MSDTLLIDLQADIEGRLKADEVLGSINVVSERTGDIAAEIQKSVGLVATTDGKRGLCLIVIQMTADPDSLEVPGPVLALKLTVRVIENPVLNNHGIAALTAARRIARILHHYTPYGMTSPILAATPCIAGIVDPLAPVAYEVSFTAREAEYSIDAKVQDPTWSATSPTATSTVTLACGTPGAAIYYTNDGSHPRAGNPMSSLYAGPIQFTQPEPVIRVAAYAAGLVASNCVQFAIG